MSIKSEQKEALMASGKWPEFCAFQESKLKSGSTPIAATKQALRKFIVGEVAERVGKKMGLIPDPEPDPVVDPLTVAGEPSAPAPALDIGTPENDFTDCPDDMIGSIPPPPAPVSLSAFEGKPDCDVEADKRWVTTNMRVRKLDVEGCPSKSAWSLLCECREDKDFRQKFLKDCYGAKVAKVKEGKPEDVELDGAEQVDVIDKILAIKERAEKAA